MRNVHFEIKHLALCHIVRKWWGCTGEAFPPIFCSLLLWTFTILRQKAPLHQHYQLASCLCSPRWRTSHQLCHRWAPQYSVGFGGDCSFDAVQVTSALPCGWHVLWPLLACLGSLEASQFAEYPSTQPSLTTGLLAGAEESGNPVSQPQPLRDGWLPFTVVGMALLTGHDSAKAQCVISNLGSLCVLFSLYFLPNDLNIANNKTIWILQPLLKKII